MKQIKLYNMIFPFWLLWIMPITWLIILPANFVLDSLLLVLFMKIIKVDKIIETYKQSIIKVWIFGFLADIIGCISLIFMVISDFGDGTYIFDALREGIMMKPLANIYSFMFTVACVMISVVLIYLLDYKIALKNTKLSNLQKKKTAILMAIFTAPYLFFLPAIG